MVVVQRYSVNVWIAMNLMFAFCVAFFFFCQLQQGTVATVMNSSHTFLTFSSLYLFIYFGLAAVGNSGYCYEQQPHFSYFFVPLSQHWVHALFTGPTNITFQQFFIKNRSHDAIYTFKNYFTTVFSISAKISCIQTDL